MPKKYGVMVGSKLVGTSSSKSSKAIDKILAKLVRGKHTVRIAPIRIKKTKR